MESDEQQSNSETPELELYGDPKISSLDAKVPLFLKATYLLLPIWGICTFYFFWNGSIGWFDRGYWAELQTAANTRFPIENQYLLPQNLDDEAPSTKTKREAKSRQAQSDE